MNQLEPQSLTRRFALVAAALSAVALVVIVLASLWLVQQQHAQLQQQLRDKQVEYHARLASATLRNVVDRMAEVSRSTILATGLVDSAGRETYLGPYLASLRQVGGIPVQVLFTDFEGQEVASNGGSFTAEQRAWLARQLHAGHPSAAIFPATQGAELVAIEPLRYSRTSSPEGALMYKMRIQNVLPIPGARLLWSNGPPPASGPDGLALDLEVPPILAPLGLKLFEELAILPAGPSLAPQYTMVVLIALLLAGGVLLLGSRFAVGLTSDLTQLEAFSREVIDNPGGTRRAEESGSAEVRSLARSINRMLETLYRQRDLLQSETDKLHQLANTIPQLAWMAGPDGQIHWFNDRCYEYTGLGRGEEIRWTAVHHPDFVKQVIEGWEQSVRTGIPFEMTFPLRAANGEYRTFFTRAAPLRDADGRIVQWFGTNTDVSPLEKAERALRESRERLKEGMYAARMAVWDMDLATEKLVFSEDARSIFGTRWTTAADFARDVEPEYLDELQAARAKAVETCSQYRQVLRLKEPTITGVLWLELRGTVVCAQGKPVLIRGITLDITERRSAEDKLREADRRKDEFLAMLAHELRNPLAPIANAADLLAHVKLDEAQLAKTSAVIARQAQHMTRLIEDLLDVSRVTRGLVQLDIQPLYVNEILDAAVEQVRSLLESRGHHLQVDRAPVSAMLWGDQTRVIQMVTNLLNNAAKYTPAGGRIRLWAAGRDGLMQIGVQDNGNGIPESLRPHLFQLFSQGERSPDRSQGGLGLGLALVKSLVTLQGGSVEVQSAGAGQGSEFILSLPGTQRSLAPEMPSPDDRSAAPDARQGDAAPLKVLVVDDNQDAANTVAALIAAHGHQVRICHDAGSAQQEAAAFAPDVLFLDIGLPDMDGYQLASRLRQLPQVAGSTMIALSGYGQARDAERSREAGFDRHLVKPASLPQILAVLNEAASETAEQDHRR